MRIIYSAVLGLLLAAIGVGCKLSDIEDPIVVSKVEKEFFVEMREQLGPSPRNLSILLRTIKVQDCLNSGIRYDLAEMPSRIRIDIDGIRTPTDCMPGAAPARETIDLDPIAPTLINFDINLKNTVNNQGLLGITQDAYTLDLETEEGLVLVNKQLRRIPDLTIWGYVTYTTVQGQVHAANFVNELAGISDITSFLTGSYGHFTVLPSSIQISGSPSTPNIRTFVHRYSGNMDDLRNLVQSHRNQPDVNIEIKLTTASGESI